MGKFGRAGKMTQQLTAQTALPEDQSSVSDIHTAAQSWTVTPFPGDPTPSSGTSGHQACIWYAYIHAGKHAK